MMKKKMCPRCGTEKFTSDFNQHRKTKDGLNSCCRSCAKKGFQDWAAKNPEVRTACSTKWNASHGAKLATKKYIASGKFTPVMKRYQQSPKGKAQRVKERLTHPEKVSARKAVHYALKTGKLVKGPCVDCGSTLRIEGHHHNGYSRPDHHLDVIWLCHTCHVQR